MTYDELLAKMERVLTLDPTIGKEWQETVNGLFKQHKALRAVVELHRESVEHKDIPAGICIEDGEQYPCPTIQAIEKELG
jgi:hypothetical protein